MANEFVIPPDITPESGETVTLIDDQTFSFRPQFGRVWSQRNSFGDPRWQFKRRYRGLRMSDKTRLGMVLKEARGGFRTIMVSPAQAPRGTWTAVCGGELLNDTAFADLATNWTASPAASVTEASSDGVYKGTITTNIQVSTDILNYNNSTAAAATLNTPIIQRWWIKAGTYVGTMQLRFRNGAGTAIGISETALSTPNGYYTYTYVTDSTTLRPALNLNSSTGSVAGDHMFIPFISASRCFLVDGGGTVTLQSRDMSSASWTKTRCSVSGSVFGHDGAGLADKLIEDGSNNTHVITQSGARTTGIADFCVSGIFSRQVDTRNVRLYVGNDGTDFSLCNFDLGAGTAGTLTNNGAAVGGRSFIADVGNGYYYCCLITRVPSAVTYFIQAAMLSGTTVSYAGDSTSAISIDKFAGTISSVPTRGTDTTTVAIAATTQTGNKILVKGGPPSQAGVLLPDDWVEIDGQLKQLTASLDFDAAGLGVLYVRPQVVRALADNTPVIVTKPMGRFVLGDNVAWDSLAGLYADFDLTFEEIYE